MEAFTFHEGSLPPGFTLDYEPAIFNLPAFALSQGAVPSISFYLLDGKREKAVTGIHFQLVDHVARSLLKTPFGSVECADHINPKVLYGFLEKIELQLKEKGVTDIYIKNPPRDYSSARLSLLETLFFNRQYLVSDAEVGTLDEVTDAPFGEVIRHSEKLRMQQGRRAGFIFHQADLEDLEEVYDFIGQCHQEKGYEISITHGELQKTARAFPERYLLFGVRQEEKLLAASISVRVNKSVLYSFLMNHEKEYNHLSPTIPLMEGMYNYCRRNGIPLFDLGTSALREKPNFSLLDFKLHIGGRPTSKFSFHKNIG
ncbi:MAG: GNAT family N-acetyltransferase [Cyclobacteriaceae bacterium]